jgi:hypothetical protein
MLLDYRMLLVARCWMTLERCCVRRMAANVTGICVRADNNRETDMEKDTLKSFF